MKLVWRVIKRTVQNLKGERTRDMSTEQGRRRRRRRMDWGKYPLIFCSRARNHAHVIRRDSPTLRLPTCVGCA